MSLAGSQEGKEMKNGNTVRGKSCRAVRLAAVKMVRVTGQYFVVNGWKPESPGENHPYCCEIVEMWVGYMEFSAHIYIHIQKYMNSSCPQQHKWLRVETGVPRGKTTRVAVARVKSTTGMKDVSKGTIFLKGETTKLKLLQYNIMTKKL